MSKAASSLHSFASVIATATAPRTQFGSGKRPRASSTRKMMHASMTCCAMSLLRGDTKRGTQMKSEPTLCAHLLATQHRRIINASCRALIRRITRTTESRGRSRDLQKYGNTAPHVLLAGSLLPRRRCLALAWTHELAWTPPARDGSGDYGSVGASAPTPQLVRKVVSSPPFWSCRSRPARCRWGGG